MWAAHGEISKLAALRIADELRRLHAVNAELLEALRWIATVNAMDYEYQKCARAAIAKAEEVKP
jgi:hypothetical protein